MLQLVFIFYPIFEVYGQTRPAEVDSTFDAYIRAVLNEIMESGHSDSLQITFAKEFFTYYKNNQNSVTAEIALGAAFAMWDNTGDDTYVHEALSIIDKDSDIWHRYYIPLRLMNIYSRNEQLEVDESID